jgi:hypothetical protein
MGPLVSAGATKNNSLVEEREEINVGDKQTGLNRCNCRSSTRFATAGQCTVACGSASMTRLIIAVSLDSSIANGPALALPICISRWTTTPESNALTIQLKPRRVTDGATPLEFFSRSRARSISVSSPPTSASFHVLASDETLEIVRVVA